MQLYLLIQKFLVKIFLFLGYELTIKKIKKLTNNDSLNLNIGAGNNVINNFLSLDFYSLHYYPSKKKFLKTRIEYDIRKNNLPFETNTVSNIYASHILEHVEEIYATKFINEAYRVLKPEGVLRIVCPDGKFLYNVSSFKNDYWNWRKKGSFSNKKRFLTDFNLIDQYDYLIREFSTPKCKFYLNKISNDLPKIDELKKLNYEELKERLKKDLIFRENYPGDHINIHDFDSLYKKGILAGFKKIIESKKNGSVSIAMQGSEFDITSPQMSLYVDMIKC